MPPAATAERELLAYANDLAARGDIAGLKALRDRLAAVQEAKQARRRFALYSAQPTRWINERLREFAWSKQREVMESVRDHRRTAVHSCHGVGKSHIASRIAAWWLDSHPVGEAFVVSTAPTYRQVKNILWRYIRQAHRKAKLGGRVNLTEWHMDGEIVAFGAKPSDTDESAFQGIHAKYVLVIIDEACGVPEQLWIAADALTTNPDCRILAIGNPDNPSAYFAKVCRPGSQWNVIHIGAEHSPNFTGEKVPRKVAELLISKTWVDEKRTEWGEDNPIFVSKCLGLFPTESTAKVVRVSDVALCRQERATPYTPAELTPIVLGVDVGGGGDETVIRERCGVKVGREWRSRSDRPEDLAPLVVKAIRESGATLVNVDENGIGYALVGDLRNRALAGEHTARIVGVNAGSAASAPDRFENLRAEMWWMARELSEHRAWDLSDMANADTTVAQLLEPEWSISKAGRILIEPKDDIRERIGRSPDNADALLLAYYVAPDAAEHFLEALLARQRQSSSPPLLQAIQQQSQTGQAVTPPDRTPPPTDGGPSWLKP